MRITRSVAAVLAVSFVCALSAAALVTERDLTIEDLAYGAKAVAQLHLTPSQEAFVNYTLGVKNYEQQLKEGSLDLLNVKYPPTFSCSTFTSSTRPTSVHKVRVADVKVVAAIGDSLTAAFGAAATTIVDVREFRGVSWSIGGDGSLPSSVTLPNVFRKYNPNVVGFSLGIGTSQTHLNVAVTGAVSQDTPGQAINLVNKMRDSREGVDFANDWKVVTFFIGANNLCRYCRDPNRDSPANYAANVRAALDTLTQVPRMIVNLVAVVDVTKLKVVEGANYPGCDSVHQTVCSCGTSNDANVRAQVSRACADYNAQLQTIANDARYQRDDFTVVYQPMYVNTEIPRDASGNPIRAYFAPDCFHFATVTHQGVAVTLWNNMLKPNGQKPAWVPGQGYTCPASTDYICTPRNQNPSAGRCNL